MSWSVNYIGTPEKIKAALAAQSLLMTGESKSEFNEAVPYINGILDQNYHEGTPHVLQLIASGHGHLGYRSLMVNVQYPNGNIV